jgi:hypothetical protein
MPTSMAACSSMEGIGGGVEIDARRGIDAHRLIDPVEAVEVHGDDLVLGVLAFQRAEMIHSWNFWKMRFTMSRRTSWKSILAKLLGDGAGPSLLTQVNSCPQGAAHVDSAV